MSMASTLTRSSSRKTGGLHTRSTRKNPAILPGNNDLNIGRRTQLPNIGRKKRPREDTENEDVHKKRAKVTIEIPVEKPTKQVATTRSHVVRSDALLASTPQDQSAHSNLNLNHDERTTKATQTLDSSASTSKPTRHHDKVVNGIKHELDRLNPVIGPGLDTGKLLKEEKRKLRSQESTRFKSELSAYFPEYDEVIGNESKEIHILNIDTPITIIDSAKPSSKHDQFSTNHNEYPLKEFPEFLFADLSDAQRVDFTVLDQNFLGDDGGIEDPLSDDYFHQIHKKPERAEKTIRNTDKGRAQHEKDQVIRLMEGLQGPEWLKLMGVNGVTDSKKKEYEPAREHFIRGCEAIIEKFKIWKDEEKRRKLAKEAALAEAEEDQEMDEEDDEEWEDRIDLAASGLSDEDLPEYSDVDASAARQLHEEAIARLNPRSRAGRKRKVRSSVVGPPQMPEVEKEFKSFFTKPHLRTAALGNGRRSNRSVVAFGQPVPEFEEMEFDLPDEPGYRDEETLRARERRKRRDRRVSKT